MQKSYRYKRDCIPLEVLGLGRCSDIVLDGSGTVAEPLLGSAAFPHIAKASGTWHRSIFLDKVASAIV
jgi:hypothetical protein